MKSKISQINNRSYMSEFALYNGDRFVTFNIVASDTARNEITVAVTDEGRISVKAYDVLSDGNGLYFEYGVMYTRVYLDDFGAVAV